MLDWLTELIASVGSAIGDTFSLLGEQVSNTIWNTMLQWSYEAIYNAVADFFTRMSGMGADIFALDWVQATLRLFTLFGWALFAAGTVVAIFDVAIEYQCDRANIKTPLAIMRIDASHHRSASTFICREYRSFHFYNNILPYYPE